MEDLESSVDAHIFSELFNQCDYAVLSIVLITLLDFITDADPMPLMTQQTLLQDKEIRARWVRCH